MEFKNVQKMYKKIPKVHFFLLYFLWRYNNMNEEFKEKSKKGVINIENIKYKTKLFGIIKNV